MRNRICLALASIILFSVSELAAQELPPHAPGEVLLAFKKTTSETSRRSALARVGARPIATTTATSFGSGNDYPRIGKVAFV
jgi:hypothetical protein